MNENIVLRGFIGKAIYNNDDFKIYSFYPTEECQGLVSLNKYGNISISGQLPELYEEVEYIIEVMYVKKGQYDNYVVQKIKKANNEINSTTTEAFLKAILTEKQSEEICRVYPDIVERVINNKEVDIDKIKGVGAKTYIKIKEKILENFKLMELVEEYFDFGMTINMIQKLYKRYSSVEKIKEKMSNNPYECLCSLNRVAFRTADKVIIQKLPNMINSKYRLLACIVQILKENESNGNTYISMVTLYKKVKEIAMECSHYFKIVLREESIFYFDELLQRVSLRATYECEKEISEIINRKLLINKVLGVDYKRFNMVNDIPLTYMQLNALGNLCSYNLSILAGVAGSGKSFSVLAMLNMLDSLNMKYCLLAPTGKSSKMLEFYTNKEAKTIHRELIYKDNGFVFNEENQLNYDVIIVDEFSMIDIHLLRSLLCAISDETKILFIGDPVQIPSVGVGNIAFDMINSDIIPITMLTEVFRFEEGGLSYVASKTREGEKYLDEHKKGLQTFGTKKDYTFINTIQEDTFKFLKTIYDSLLKKGVKVDDILVLSCMNKGDYGTIAINTMIQSMVNPNTSNQIKIKRNDREVCFRVNDKVIQTKNNYNAEDVNVEESRVYNGDIGTIISIENGKLHVAIDNKVIVYEREDLNGLDLAYAISIHKSQGSSSKYVIVVTPKAHKFFINKNLLYVGLTRGRDKVFHISSFDVINSALKKSANFSRKTYLSEMLKVN